MVAKSDTLTLCETAAAGTGRGTGVGEVSGLVPLPPPDVEFDVGEPDRGPGFVTLKKFPATTLSASPADSKTPSASKPNRFTVAALRASNPSSDASDVSIMISVL